MNRPLVLVLQVGGPEGRSSQCSPSSSRTSRPPERSSTTDRAELFLYPGEQHLFADSSLPAYDPAAAALLSERVLTFLDAIPAAEGY